MSSHGVFLEIGEEISGCRFYYGGRLHLRLEIFAGDPNQDSRNVSIRKGNGSAVTAHRRWDETNVVKQRQTKLHHEKERMCREDCQYGKPHAARRACWESASAVLVRSWSHQVWWFLRAQRGIVSAKDAKRRLISKPLEPPPSPPFSSHKSDNVRDPDSASRYI
jgi:hypothetical protein